MNDKLKGTILVILSACAYGVNPLIAVKIYHDSFGGAFRLGYASAFAWMLFAVIGLLTFIVFKTSGKWVYYED